MWPYQVTVSLIRSATENLVTDCNVWLSRPWATVSLFANVAPNINVSSGVSDCRSSQASLVDRMWSLDLDIPPQWIAHVARVLTPFTLHSGGRSVCSQSWKKITRQMSDYEIVWSIVNYNVLSDHGTTFPSFSTSGRSFSLSLAVWNEHVFPYWSYTSRRDSHDVNTSLDWTQKLRNDSDAPERCFYHTLGTACWIAANVQ